MAKRQKVRSTHLKVAMKEKAKLAKKNKKNIVKRKRPKIIKSNTTEKRPRESEQDEMDDMEDEDLLSMVEKSDLEYLASQVGERISADSAFSGLSHRSMKHRQDENHIEESYEQRMASRATEDAAQVSQRPLLPIKTANKLIPQFIDVRDKEEKENDERQNDDTDDLKISGCSGPVSAVDLLEVRETELQSRKFKIGNWASALIENPEENVEHLKHLVSLLDEQRPGLQVTVKKLASLTLLEVFSDIIPSYKIVHHDGDTKLKKETRKLWKYENILLSSYKAYLSHLEKMCSMVRSLKQSPEKPQLKALYHLGVMATDCLCKLLVTHPHFNFTSNIVTFIVTLALHPDPDVGEKCCMHLTQLFRQDNLGEITLQAVRQLYRLVKKHSYKIPGRLLGTLLHLRVTHINPDAEMKEAMPKADAYLSGIKRKKLSRKQYQEFKEKLATKRDMQALQAEHNVQLKQRYQTETLNVVFTVYFRIIKSKPNPDLLSAVLAGLAKFAHLINVDFFSDLVNVLHELSSSGDLIPTQALHCVQTVFTILNGQGQAFTIDPQRFYGMLYNTLLDVIQVPSEDFMESVVRTVDVAILQQRKSMSPNQLAAFCKRLVSIALHTDVPHTLAFLSIVQPILASKRKLLAMVESDGEEGLPGALSIPITPGMGFQEEMPFSIIAELQILMRHHDSMVKAMAKHILNGCPATGPSSMPMELVRLSPLEIQHLYSQGRSKVPMPSLRTGQVAKVRETFEPPLSSILKCSWELARNEVSELMSSEGFCENISSCFDLE